MNKIPKSYSKVVRLNGTDASDPSRSGLRAIEKTSGFLAY